MSASYSNLQQVDERQQTDQDFQFLTEGAENLVSDIKPKYHQLSSGKSGKPLVFEEEDQSFKISPSNINSQRENHFLHFGQRQHLQQQLEQIPQEEYSQVQQNLSQDYQLIQANERLDNMLRLNDFLKRENANLCIQKKRIEDQFNSQTMKFAALQRKYTSLENVNKELNSKVISLEQEKKQLLLKWQKASSMLKDEQSLKNIAKNIENILISVSNEFMQINGYLCTYPKQLLNLKQNLTGIQEKLNVIVNFQDDYLNLQQKSTNLTIRTFAKEKTMTNQENTLDQTQDLKAIISDMTDELSELRYILYANKKDLENKNSQIEHLQNKLNSTTMQFTQLYNTLDKSQQVRRMPSFDQERILKEVIQQPNQQYIIHSIQNPYKDSWRNLSTYQKENVMSRTSLSNSGKKDYTPIKSAKKNLSSSQKKLAQNNQQQFPFQQLLKNQYNSSLNTSYN